MNNNIVSNPNDFKVVELTNSSDFTFTPEMGCMYDGKPIFGITGAPGINAGESMKLPYHVGHRLAVNLAKVVMTRRAPTVDPAGIPTGVPLWSSDGLEKLKNSFLTDLYTEAKPIAQTETQRLLAKVEELNKWKEGIEAERTAKSNEPKVEGGVLIAPASTSQSTGYADKADVIAELNKRGIKFDARQNKSNLEKLIV
jgi:hypothetical protein